MDGQPPPPPPPHPQSQPSLPASNRAAQTTKTGKRKRLSKACDACHKSKRRCDGTAPCSNCYFAEKECTYTSSSGRPVPAPRPARPHGLPLPSDQPPVGSLSPPHAGVRPYPPSAAAQLHVHQYQQPEAGPSRKRSRSEYNAAPILPSLPPPEHRQRLALDLNSSLTLHPAELPAGDSSIVLEPALVRELVNLFFAHCHPARMIIHKPSFSAALSRNQVPSYLLHAVCAHGVRHSRQPRLRAAQPHRLASMPFHQAAIASMFDSQGRLAVPPDLEVVQALTLVQMAEFHEREDLLGTSRPRYHEMAIKIVKKHDLRASDPFASPVHGPSARSGSSSPPVPSDAVASAIERECLRRCGWLIYSVNLLGSIYMDKTMESEKINTATTCLPFDETHFELAELALTTSPEHLDEPAPQSEYASEFGHFIRVATIFHRAKSQLAAAADSPNLDALREALENSERALETWVNSLPPHLRFSKENLDLQLSMFETSSNSGAWCFCMIHVLHSSCALALAGARAKASGERVTPTHPAAKQLTYVVGALGTRASNSFLKALAVFPLLTLYPPDDPLLIEWQAEVERVWNVKISDIAAALQRMRVPSASPPGPNSTSSSERDAGELSPVLSSPRSSESYAEPPLLAGGAAAQPRSHGVAGLTQLPSLRESGLLGTWDSPQGPPPPLPLNAAPMTPLGERAPYQHLPPPQAGAPSVPRPAASAPRGLAWLLDEQQH